MTQEQKQLERDRLLNAIDDIHADLRYCNAQIEARRSRGASTDSFQRSIDHLEQRLRISRMALRSLSNEPNYLDKPETVGAWQPEL